MFRKIENNNEIKKIENFIEPILSQCVYLYINLHNYSKDSENIDVYVDDKNGEYSIVVLRYYGTLHIYCVEGYDHLILLDFINEIKPQVIFMPEKNGRAICNDIKEKYEYEIMRNYLLPKGCGEYFEEVSEVTINDLDRVVEFLFDDPVYVKSYRSKKDLYNQLESRLSSNTSRYFKIVQDGKIVALDGTNGETEKVATTGSLLVGQQNRGQGIARKIVFGMRYILCKLEHKTVYGLVSAKTDSVAYLFEQLGGSVVGAVYKFHKK